MPSTIRIKSRSASLLLVAFLAGWSPPSAGHPIAEPLAGFGADAQEGIRAHHAQIRARQSRLRDLRAVPLPQVANSLTLSNEQASVPLRLKDRPPARPRLAPSPIGRQNAFIRGNLQSDARDGTGSGLSTSDLTLGSDHSFSENVMFGVAAGRLSTRAAVGTTLTTYLTLQPVERVHVDFSLSLSAHQARVAHSEGPDGDIFGAAASSRGLSMSLKHPRKSGAWTWSPFARYEHIVTRTRARAPAGDLPTAARDLSVLSFGSLVETIWGTPLGELRPTMRIELQRDATASAGSAAAQTQGIVGVAVTTRVSREMTAFAESQYALAEGADPNRHLMLGVRLAF